MIRQDSRSLPFVLAATDHGTFIVSRFDRATNANGQPYGVGFQLLETGTYDPEDLGLIFSQLIELRNKRGDGVVAVDCGANIGIFSLEMARLMRGWGAVFAFEAQERLFYALAGNIALANAFNITARHAAIGEAPGQIKIPQPNYCAVGSLGSLELKFRRETEFIGQRIDYNDHALTPVPLTSIDALGLDRVDFIKIDVEGMELEVLRGAEMTLRMCRPQLWIEWIKTDRAALLDLLSSRNYRVELERGMNILAISNESP